jgi:protein-S-isoprenylcysteine O-methyltransferase Ste14
VIVIRVILLAGLVLHKVLWEVWKCRDAPAQPAAQPPLSTARRAVKTGKAAMLGFLVVQTACLNVLPMPGNPRLRRGAGLLLFLAGLGLAVAGRGQLGKSWSNIEDGQVLPGQVLVSEGVYRYVRHPIYAGDALLLFGLQLALNSWLALAMFGPLLIFARRAVAEEKILSQGIPGYADYMKRSRRFLPFVL